MSQNLTYEEVFLSLLNVVTDNPPKNVVTGICQTLNSIGELGWKKLMKSTEPATIIV